MRNAPDFRIAAAARGFVLLALGGPILWDQKVPSVIALAALGTGWLLALSLEMRVPWRCRRSSPVCGGACAVCCWPCPRS